MSRDALDAIVLNEIADQPDLTPNERIKRAIDIALALLNVSIEKHD
ncbi:hypothetical protein [Sphingomonas sp.]|jgi:hypothetical protein|nr:hypothetical protein [Sphingomonas sp.]MDF2494231.1 hypothetical protein [Sphingomonas sp.]